MKKDITKYVGFLRTNYKIHMKPFVDLDYINKLSIKDKQWMSQFLDEYYNRRISKINPIHNTDDLRKKCYELSNSAERDVMSSKETSVYDISLYSDAVRGNDNDFEYQLLLIDIEKIIRRWRIKPHNITKYTIYKAYKYLQGEEI